jgi:hypothetical protein
VVAGLGDLDDRRHPAQLVVHVGPDVLGDQPVLGPEQRQPAADLGQVGQGHRAHAPGELGEHLAVELPAPAALHLAQRAAGYVVEDVRR